MVRDPGSGMTGLLEISGLSKTFGGLRAVDDVTCSVSRGEVVGLIGPNGAGKTTTFNLLSGFARPDRGRVVFDGDDVTGWPPHALARRGLVRSFQTAKMFPSMSVREIVLTAAMLHGSRRQASIVAGEVIERLGLDERRDSSADELSLPDRQLVELAKCLAMQPKLVLLDEIMGGLNRSECDTPMAAIRQLRDSGITFLLVEHVMPIVMTLTDHIVVLDFGKKLAEGTPAEIAAHPDVAKSYLGDGDRDGT